MTKLNELMRTTAHFDAWPSYCRWNREYTFSVSQLFRFIRLNKDKASVAMVPKKKWKEGSGACSSEGHSSHDHFLPPRRQTKPSQTYSHKITSSMHLHPPSSSQPPPNRPHMIITWPRLTRPTLRQQHEYLTAPPLLRNLFFSSPALFAFWLRSSVVVSFFPFPKFQKFGC